MTIIILVFGLVWLGFFLISKLWLTQNGEYQPNKNVLPVNRDISTFHLLPKNQPWQSEYSLDRDGVYYGIAIIPGADPLTFRLLMPETFATLYQQYSHERTYDYAVDKNRVYFQGQVVEGVDPLTFVTLENGFWRYVYGKDKSAVYYEGKLIPNANPQTFEILWQQVYEGCGKGHYYTKDKNSVYFKNSLVVGADPTTFVTLINSYGKDKNGVYNDGVLQPGLNPNTFIEPTCNYG